MTTINSTNLAACGTDLRRFFTSKIDVSVKHAGGRRCPCRGWAWPKPEIGSPLVVDDRGEEKTAKLVVRTVVAEESIAVGIDGATTAIVGVPPRHARGIADAARQARCSGLSGIVSVARLPCCRVAGTRAVFLGAVGRHGRVSDNG